MALEAEKVIPHHAEEILKAYASKDFHEHLAAKVGSELKSFEVSGTSAQGYEIVTKQAMSVDRLPDIAKRLFKGTMNVTVTDSWGPPDASGSRRSDTRVEVAGAPVKGLASQNLHARGESETLATVRGEVEVKIPLIGNKVKSAAEPYIAKFIELQTKEVSKFITSQSEARGGPAEPNQ